MVVLVFIVVGIIKDGFYEVDDILVVMVDLVLVLCFKVCNINDQEYMVIMIVVEVGMDFEKVMEILGIVVVLKVQVILVI